jgi:hypothetical protein
MCCGSSRQRISTGAQRLSGSAHTQAAAPVKPVFEYIGATALTVVSPITRKTYRFERPGVRVEVDARDRSWVAFVPNLARVGQ